jgi:hypothetical protein
MDHLGATKTKFVNAHKLDAMQLGGLFFHLPPRELNRRKMFVVKSLNKRKMCLFRKCTFLLADCSSMKAKRKVAIREVRQDSPLD